jgi:hypothetical protein
MAQVMATVRPRLYIIEAGNSFGLLADYFRSLDLSVHRVTLKAGENVSLPPFSDALRLPEALLDREAWNADELADVSTTSDATDALDELTETGDGEGIAPANRDLLGEMELIALIMITGGELAERERLTRSDRRTVRDAICRANGESDLAEWCGQQADSLT